MTGMIRRIKVALALAALGAVATPAAAQDQYVYYNVCGAARVNTSLTVCASADVTLIGSTLRMRVWNMEIDGAAGMSSYASAQGGWHTIVSVGLDYMGTGTASGGELAHARYIFGTGGDDYNELTVWRNTNDAGVPNPLRVELGSMSDGHHEGIVGCVDPGPVHALHVQTCRNYGFLPFVSFTFTNVDPNIDFASYNFDFMSFQVGSDLSDWAKVSGQGIPQPPAVVPEPITMVLLGSGLLGIGGANLRRRRSALEVETADEA